RGERRAIPGAVCEERATKPAGLRAAAQRGAAAGGHLLCCRSSTMSDIACVAAPRICPPGARAKVLILFLHRPLSPGSPAKSFAGVTQSGQSASPTKRKPVVRIHPPAPSVAVVLRSEERRVGKGCGSEC